MNNSIENMDKDLEQTSHQQMANKHLQICSTLENQVIRGMQIKQQDTIINLVEAKIQNIATPKCCKGGRTTAHSLIAGGNVKWTTILEDSLVDSYKT